MAGKLNNRSDRHRAAESVLRRRGAAAALAIVLVSAVPLVGFASPAAAANAPTIFQVELRNCANLHVGYNQFPAGTVVRWNVTQSAPVVAPAWFVSTGQFTTLGGGKTYHFLTQPLGSGLWPNPDGHVHFHWTINNTDFSSTAIRKPGCAGLRWSSPKSVRVGATAHFAAIDPCPSGSSSVSLGFLVQGGGAFPGGVAVAADGSWSLDSPTNIDTPLTALATATCRGPNGNAPALALYYSRPITILP